MAKVNLLETQWKTVAMVAYEKLSRTDFKSLLRALVAISYRYNLIGKQQTNENLRKIISQLPTRISKAKRRSTQQVSIK